MRDVFIVNVNINIGAGQNQGAMLETATEIAVSLDDTIKGKQQPWRKKKNKSLKLATALHALGQKKRANRVYWCSDVLGFQEDAETGKKTLKTALFCRERLCVMCSWRKSIKMFYQLSKVMDVAQEEKTDIKPIFLTLTVRNCKGEELKDVLGMMFKGWKSLMEHRKIRDIQEGWFRALEVTYNEKSDTYHPHFHALIMVKKSYFLGTKYLTTQDWIHLWKVSCKLDYSPICDVRAIKTEAPRKHKHIAEVAKYTVKDADYIFKDEQLTAKVVDVLGQALKGRRLYAFGGYLKDVAKRLKADDPEKGDLVNIEGDFDIREDVADNLLAIYKWDFVSGDYIRQD